MLCDVLEYLCDFTLTHTHAMHTVCTVYALKYNTRIQFNAQTASINDRIDIDRL